MAKYHQQRLEDILEELGTNDDGLDNYKARKRLKLNGPNLLQAPKKENILVKFLKQFKEFLIILLLVTAVICLFIPDHKTDALVIFTVVILNAIIGFIQEYRAEKAIFALKRLSANKAIVIRNAVERKISAADLVKGDRVVLKPGIKIPADCRLLEAKSLEIDESILTGESNPLHKDINDNPKDIPLAERRNMAYMGTLVTAGKGKGIIVSKGMDTEIGKITKMVFEEDETDTPLVKQLDKFGKVLAVFAMIIGFILAVLVWVKQGMQWQFTGVGDFFATVGIPLLTGVSIMVAVVPEGLPVVVALTLTLGMKNMAKKKAIVRRLTGVETLGCTTYICTDKTGTLTKNQMTVKKIYLDGKIIKVSGEGYNSKGEFFIKGKKSNPRKNLDLDLLIKFGSLCNDAQSIKRHGKLESSGSPTDRALFHLGTKAKLDFEDLKEQYPQIAKIPFTSERKIMITFHTIKDSDEILVVTKGAPEIVLDLCRKARVKGKEVQLKDELRRRIKKMNIKLGIKTYRNLGLAYARVKPEDLVIPTEEDQKDIKKFLQRAIKFNFLGLFALWDPPRKEAIDSIKLCKRSGIKVVMVTGDQTATALAVAEKIGIYKDGDKILTGSDLDLMDDKEFEKIVKDVVVYSRTSPQHKMRIVQGLKAQDEVVAMTGDGVNDAPALTKADIGIAMGQSGSDVARDASTMILTDDNFATIVKAVEEGRKIYSNIKRFVRYQLSSNVGVILLIVFSILLGFPIPLFPVQILWINILIDGPPAIALGMEPVTQNVMNSNPRPKTERILKPMIIISVLTLGGVMALGTTFLYWFGLNTYGSSEEFIGRARTIAFTGIVISQLFNVLNCKSETETIFSKRLFSNKFVLVAISACLILQMVMIYTPFGQMFFRTVPLSPFDWIIILAISISIICVEELVKLARRNRIKAVT